MLWNTKLEPPPPPGLRRGGGRCSSAPARKKGLGGLLFLLSDSIYMGGCLLCYPGRLCGAMERRPGGGGEWSSLPRHHRDFVSTALVSRPPGSVRNHTFGCPGGAVGSRFPAAHPFLSPSLRWPHVAVVSLLCSF